MKKNKLIYDYILKNYNNNRINSYRKFENKLKDLLKLKLDFKNKNNIRILLFIQKMEDSQYFSTNQNEEEENKKNKEKSNNHGKNIYNKESLSIDFSKSLRHKKKDEKYLFYNKMEYPNKNFPESRSEFIFAQESKEYYLEVIMLLEDIIYGNIIQIKILL